MTQGAALRTDARAGGYADICNIIIINSQNHNLSFILNAAL